MHGQLALGHGDLDSETVMVTPTGVVKIGQTHIPLKARVSLKLIDFVSKGPALHAVLNADAVLPRSKHPSKLRRPLSNARLRRQCVMALL